MDQVLKATKPLVSIDWTTSEGEVPFYDHEMQKYAVAVKTGFSRMDSDYRNANTIEWKLSGVEKIIAHHNKVSENIDQIVDVSVIPQQASGTYVPLRPQEEIKVLVTVPTELVDALEDLPPLNVAAYDVVSIELGGLANKAQSIFELLRVYDGQATNFVGRIYDADFLLIAKNVKNFTSTLSKLVADNGFLPDTLDRSIVEIGVDSEYLPLYAQIDQGNGFEDLIIGFNEFKRSKFVDSNTLFIYSKLDEVLKYSKQKPIVGDDAAQSTISEDWQNFLKSFIKYPPAIIEHSESRPMSPTKTKDDEPETPSIQTEEDREKAALKKRTEEYRNKVIQSRERAKEWVGSNVLRNAQDAYNELNSLEDAYYDYLDKLGVTNIVSQAMRCIELPVDLNDIRQFLLDGIRLTEEVVDLLDTIKTPVIVLDDLLPTIDAMADIAKSIGAAILEALKRALFESLKRVLFMIAQSCVSPVGVEYGGLNLSDALATREGRADLALSAVGGLGPVVSAGFSAGVSNTGEMGANGSKFLKNLRSKLSDEQISAITSPLNVAWNISASEAQKTVFSLKNPLHATKSFFNPGGGTASERRQTFSEIDENYEGSVRGAMGEQIRGALAGGPRNNSNTETLVNNGLESESPLSIFLDSITSNITIGEANKLLLGAPNRPTLDIIGQISESLMVNSENDPRFVLLNELLGDEEKIKNFFQSMGKVIDMESISDQVDRLSEITPDSLCDEDDREIRCELLSGKLLTAEQCEQQVLASRARARKRLAELGNMLSSDNALDGVIPDIFPKRDENGVIQPGLIPMGHPSLNNMMDKTLNTIFKGAYQAFKQDSFETTKLFIQETDGAPLKIPRLLATSERQGTYEAGGSYWRMNPEFEFTVKQGYQPTPPYFRAQPEDASSRAQEEANIKTIEETYKLIQSNPSAEYLEKPTTKMEFVPGLRDAYREFETSLAETRIDLSKYNKARNRLDFSNNKKTVFVTTENFLRNRLRGLGDGAYDNIVQEMTRLSGVSADSLLGIDRYAVLYTNFSDETSEKDKFSVLLKAYTSLNSFDVSDMSFTIDLSDSVSDVVGNISDIDSPNHTLVERRFVSFLSDILNEGENIYVDGARQPAPEYVGGISLSDTTRFKEVLLRDQLPARKVQSLFREISRDLLALCLAEAGNSRLLDTDTWRKLNLAPLPTQECPDPTVIHLNEVIKSIKRMHSTLQYELNVFPDASAGQGTKGNAFEQSTLYGVVKAIIRVHCIEFVIKTLINFSELNIEDATADQIIVTFIRERLKEDLQLRGFYNDFAEQCLESYNHISRNRENSRNPVPQTNDPIEAMDWFIRGEIRYVVRKITTIAGVNNDSRRVDNLLINQNSALDGWVPEFDAGTNSRLDETPEYYHVGSKSQIVGFRDWRNGNIFLEKYVRVETKEWVSGSHAEVFGLEDYRQKMGEYFSRDLAGNVTGFAGASVGGFPSVPDTEEVLLESDDCAPQPTTINVPGSDSPHTVGRYYKSLRYGLRLVCQAVQDYGANEGIRQHPLITNYSNEIRDNQGNPDYEKNKSYRVLESSGGLVELEAIAIPIVCVEQEISPDMMISDILDDNNYLWNNFPRNDLMGQIKQTNEYDFIFDYCFPLKRYVSISALYNYAYVLPVGLENAFLNTKEQLRMAFFAASQSGRYSQVTLGAFEDPRFVENFGLMGLMLILGLFKGIGETFSPNVSLAKIIQDAPKLALEMAAKVTLRVWNSAIANQRNLAVVAFNLGYGPKPDPEDYRFKDKCDLPEWMREDVEVPLWIISLALLPMDIPPGPPFFPLQPLTPLGIAYVAADTAGIFDSFKERTGTSCENEEQTPEGIAAACIEPEED